MTIGLQTQGGMMRPILKDPSGMELLGGPGYGNTDNPGLDSGSLSTVGAGTITNKIIDGGLIYRTGPTAAYTDTFDTAANLDAGVGNGMSPGDCMVIWYSNQVAFAATIAGASGVTLTSTKTSIAASALGCLILKKLTNAVQTASYGSNGQPTPNTTTPGTYALYVL